MPGKHSTSELYCWPNNILVVFKIVFAVCISRNSHTFPAPSVYRKTVSEHHRTSFPKVQMLCTEAAQWHRSRIGGCGGGVGRWYTLYRYRWALIYNAIFPLYYGSKVNRDDTNSHANVDRGKPMRPLSYTKHYA